MKGIGAPPRIVRWLLRLLWRGIFSGTTCVASIVVLPHSNGPWIARAGLGAEGSQDGASDRAGWCPLVG